MTKAGNDATQVQIGNVHTYTLLPTLHTQSLTNKKSGLVHRYICVWVSSIKNVQKMFEKIVQGFASN